MRTIMGITLCSLLFLGSVFHPQAAAHEHAGEAQATTPAWAGRITEDNAPVLVMGGPDAIGGINDWFITNGEICGVVSDINHENELGPTGGILVDLGFCNRNDDQFLYWHELLNMEIPGSFIVEEIRAENDGHSAQIIVEGRKNNVRSKTIYHADKDTPQRITITTEYHRLEESGEPIRGFAEVLATLRSLIQFDLSTDGAVRSRGFVHHTPKGGMSAFSRAASASDLMIYVGQGIPDRNITYGQRVLNARRITSKGKTYALPRYFLTDEISTGLAVFSNKYFFGNPLKLGFFNMLQVRFFDLKMGDRIIVEQEILIAKGHDVAGITDQVYAGEPLLQGTAGEPGAVIHINRADGSPLTQITTGDEGDFGVHVPPGDYQIIARGHGGRSVTQEISVTTQGTNHIELSLGPRAVISLPQRQTMRLTFIGKDNTDDPDFSDDLSGFALVDKDTGPRPAAIVRDINLAGLPSDTREVVLAPGTYRVYASRGPEYSLSSTVIDAVAGETRPLNISLPERIVNTPGWIAADMHVHSGASFDTDLPVDERLASYLAQGGEVLVSTEHDNAYDFMRDIERLGLTDRLAYVIGAEITSELKSETAPHTIGHANAFPLPKQPFAYRRGAPAHENRRWRDVIAGLRQLPTNPVVQLNHARFTKEPGDYLPTDKEEIVEPQAFFSHMGSVGHPFDRHQPLTSGDNAVLAEPDPKTGVRDIDFDALELLNGPYYASYRDLRDDWFALLRQGERLTGTANSDSHRLTTTDMVLVPRNMVLMNNDAVDDFDTARFIAAIREGRLYGTTGPLFTTVRLGEAGIGDMHHGKDGMLSVIIETAPWVDIDVVRVFDNGIKIHESALEAGTVFELPMHFEQDSFVIVEVEGEAAGEFAAVLPGHIPFAFTNPIYVDADGDGTWTPIGSPLP